jgi:UDP-N-acetyl-D-mannosaminuronic acid transferase (WecB/TagA/CpsF family)
MFRDQPTTNHEQRTTVNLFGIDIDVLRMDGAVARLKQWIDDPKDGPCRYVVTPNVDHAVVLQRHAAFREAYADADLVVVDGAPVVLASCLLGKPLPERISGADLVPALFDAAGRASAPAGTNGDACAANASAAGRDPLRVYLLGAGPGVTQKGHRLTFKELKRNVFKDDLIFKRFHDVSEFKYPFHALLNQKEQLAVL